MAKKASQESLDKWTKQKWRTKSGKPSGETGERYLPEKAIKSLSSAEYAATTRAKREGTAKGNGIDYEDTEGELTFTNDQTEAFISSVENFTEIKGLRTDTVNEGNEAETDSQYELGADLQTLVRNNCQDMLAVYYPDLVP